MRGGYATRKQTGTLTIRKYAEQMRIQHGSDSRSIGMVTFEEIEAKRAEAGITRKALYEAAGVHKETWRRTASRKTAPNTRTLERLTRALDELVECKGEPNGSAR